MAMATLTQTVLAVLWFSLCVKLTLTQVGVPVPVLSFGESVNVNDIALFSEVELICTLPAEAQYPLYVYLGRDSDPLVPWVMTYHRTVVGVWFPTTVKLETEGALVCWYNTTLFNSVAVSNLVNLSISSVPPPIASLAPSLFPVGGNYTVNCNTPVGPFTNVTLSLYFRPLPVTAGNDSLVLIGSLALGVGDTGIMLQRAGATETVEYACRMKVFYGGRVLGSTPSNLVPAIPEEIPARLWSQGQGTGCIGRLEVKVRGRWAPACQSYYTAAAGVACRELGCGQSIGSSSYYDSTLRVGTQLPGPIRCSGSERRIRECPIDDLQSCRSLRTLNVMCSDVLPPPKLTVSGYGSVSSLYISNKQSLEITCSFSSRWLSSSDVVRVYLYHVTKGDYMTYRSVSQGVAVVTQLDPPVMAGEYACLARYSGSVTAESGYGNSVVITTGDWSPPTSGLIVAAVLSALTGAGILFCLCVFRAHKEATASAMPTQEGGAGAPEAMPGTDTQTGSANTFQEGETESTARATATPQQP